MKNNGNIASLPGRSDPLLVRTFLRHYAYNLQRSWRNTPHHAFVDALIQFEVPLTLVIVSPLAVVIRLLGRTVFPSLAHLAYKDMPYGGVMVCVLAFATIWVVDRKLRPYEFIADVSIGYDSARDRRLVYFYFGGAFVFALIMFFVAQVLDRVFPTS